MKFKHIILAAALLAASATASMAEGIGQNMSVVGQSGQGGILISEGARAGWSWGANNQANQGSVRKGANAEAVTNYPGGPSPQGSQLPDLIILLEEAGLL